MTTYVHEEIEVKKTGRVAAKVLPSGKTDTKYEITPVSDSIGVWKKWVREAELYDVDQGQDNATVS